METLQQMTIGEMVTQDYRTAAVFQSFGINFCCKGKRSIKEACEKIKINANEVWVEIEKEFANVNKNSIDFSFWSIDTLSDYIEKKHHRYVKERIPLLIWLLNKICKTHGNMHPELFDIKKLFTETAIELTAHMRKEQTILFPYLKQMFKKLNEGSFQVDFPYFRSVKNPIKMMMEEHENEGERFATIAVLADNYTPPSDACNTYRVTLALLHEFEKDLHMHFHLENNVLFPKSILHEEELYQL